MSERQQSLGEFEQRLLTELTRVVIEDRSPSPAPAESAPAARVLFRGRRPLALAGGVAAALAVAIAAGLPIGGDGGGTPAYAVTEHPDGTVTVEIDALSDAAGLERELAEAGIPALVQYLPPGKTCAGESAPHTTVAKGAGAPPLDGGAESGTVRQTDGRHEDGGPTLESAGAPPAMAIPDGGAPPGEFSVAVTTHEDGSVGFTIDKIEHPGQTLVIRTHELAPGQALPGEQVPAPVDGPASAVAVSFEAGEPRPCEVVDAE
jgi:hypothetical protein